MRSKGRAENQEDRIPAKAMGDRRPAAGQASGGAPEQEGQVDLGVTSLDKRNGGCLELSQFLCS